MADITVRPFGRSPDMRLELPGSTLAAPVAMAAAALADGLTALRCVPMNATTERMVAVLRTLGTDIRLDEGSCELRVRGCGGHLPAQEGTFDCGTDPLVAHLAMGLCALGYGQFRVDARRQPDPIPVRAMVDALGDLGGHIGYADEDGHLPVTVRAPGLRGGRIALRAGPPEALIALLTVAPYAQADVFVESARPADVPSVAACCEMISRFGVSVVQQDFERFIVPAPQRYRCSRSDGD